MGSWLQGVPQCDNNDTPFSWARRERTAAARRRREARRAVHSAASAAAAAAGGSSHKRCRSSDAARAGVAEGPALKRLKRCGSSSSGGFDIALLSMAPLLVSSH